MNKQLVELQRGSGATCVVILEDCYKELERGLIMEAKISDAHLFAHPYGNPIFKEKLNKISRNYDLAYFIIRGISELDIEAQNRYVGLVKDREFGGYNLPNNIVIVFTVKNAHELQKISKDLYHFCVVAF